ncbi:hypothetical protein POR16_06340 [Pseudomonas coronafaciens pv. oryzae str. 1_6]|nr:hypothetical protein POR16_06340 [Pseudomonas coronafaciens pv. oryzae str. 1_6]
MLPRRKTKIQLHSLTVSSAGAEFLYHQRSILFTDWSITARRKQPDQAEEWQSGRHRCVFAADRQSGRC